MTYFFDLLKVSKMTIFYMPKVSKLTSESQSESEFNFVINSASDFDSTSEFGSESESDFSLVFMKLDICVFFHPLFTLF